MQIYLQLSVRFPSMVKISQVGLDQDFYDELVLKKVGKTLADLGNICNFVAVFKVFQEKRARIMEERKFKNRLEEVKAGIRKTRKAEELLYEL